MWSAVGRSLVLVAVVGAALSIAPGRGRAADGPAEVEVSDYRFDPETVTVNVGESVTWRVTEGVHTITARNGAFSAGERSAGDVFVFRFDTPGRFAYQCEYDFDIGMTGVVEVRATAAGAVATSTTTTAPPTTTTVPAETTTTTTSTTTTSTTTTTVPPAPASTVAPPPAGGPQPAAVDPAAGGGAAPPPAADPPVEGEALSVSRDEEPAPRETGLLVAMGVVLALLLLAGGYAWYHRPSRYLPA